MGGKGKFRQLFEEKYSSAMLYYCHDPFGFENYGKSPCEFLLVCVTYVSFSLPKEIRLCQRPIDDEFL